MNKLFHTLLLITLTLIITGCRTDASVSLAECIEFSFRELIDSNQREITSRCDIGLTGNYFAVLHPAFILDDEAYKARGLDDRTIATLRSLQGTGPGHESIFIIPLNDRGHPSRTTSQGNIVNVQDLIVVKKSDPYLTFTLEWFPETVKVVKLK